MSLKNYLIAGIFACCSLDAAAQVSPPAAQSVTRTASRELLAEGMAMLDGIWAGNETSRKATDAMTTTVSTGTFESRMDRETYTATVTNEGQIFNVRLEPGALIYSSAERPGEQRREITTFFPVDESGNWFIAVSYVTPFADGKVYEVEETYRMDGGVYTRIAAATPTDGSGPPTLIRWGSFKKQAE